MTSDTQLTEARRLARSAPGLELLLLYGSRARGEAHAHSDWDFGYLAGAGFDEDGFRVELSLLLETDDVDLVDLSRQGYAEAFRELGRIGVVDPELADRLARAAGFRNVIVHAYEKLDMDRVYRVAAHGPKDIRRFFAAVRDAI